MYIRPQSEDSGTIRIPDNYSGNAFPGDALTPSSPIELPTEGQPPVTKDTIPENEETHPVILHTEEMPKEAPVMKKASPFSSLLPPKTKGTHGGLLGDIGIEEILIIGVLILLSQSETDDDILLLLVLLLFYK